MTTTDQQVRATNPVRSVRATVDDPFATRDDLGAVVDAALADVVRRLDDLFDDTDGYEANLLGLANDVAAFRSAMRDLFRLHRHAVEPTKPRAVDFDWCQIQAVSTGRCVWREPTGWAVVRSVAATDGQVTLDTTGGPITAKPGDVVRVAK